MCVIIESYMPLDFYIEMYGAKSHALILTHEFFIHKFKAQLMTRIFV